MRHRFVKITLGLAAFMLLGGTATVAARSHHAAAGSYNVGVIYSSGASTPSARWA